MNRPYIYCLLFMVVVASCDDAKNVIDEPVGESDFLLSNQLSDSLFVKVYTNPQVLEFKLAADETVILMEKVAGDFGIHAYPEDYLDSIELFSYPDPSLLKTYNSISKDDWEHQTPEGYVWWEQAIYQLNVNEQFLAN